MPDATMEHFGELVGLVSMGVHPILPRPEWGQDAAYLAFVIDGLREKAAASEPPLMTVKEWLSDRVWHIHKGVLYSPDYGGTCHGCLEDT